MALGDRWCVSLVKTTSQRHITPDTTEEIKIDGYRCIAVTSGERVKLYSRTRKSFNRQFSHIVDALAGIPSGTVLDGELVAIDEQGRQDFNLLQSFRSAANRIQYHVFDLLCLNNRDTTRVPLIERRALLKSLSFQNERIKIVDCVEAEPHDLLMVVRQQQLEGIIGKQRDSFYQPGKRSGAWIKYRANRGQGLVIGGYVPGVHGLDSVIVGYYRGEDLIYVARVRNGFVPASRRQLFRRLQALVVSECPFVNLPETHRSRWGEGLTAQEMKECVWLRPRLVAQIEFLEWTGSDHLRHAKFAGLRADKDARKVVKESGREG